MLAIIRTSQEALESIRQKNGVAETLRPQGTSPCVPFAPDAATDNSVQLNAADASPLMTDAAYLTDSIEYCVGTLARMACIQTLHTELSAKPVMSLLLSLLPCQRNVIRDSAARVLYTLVALDDPLILQEYAGIPEFVSGLTTCALRQHEAPAAVPIDAVRTARSTRRSLSHSLSRSASARILATTRAVDAPIVVYGNLSQLAARALLSLSAIKLFTPQLERAHGGDALMLLYNGDDATARRWALLALCNLFKLSEQGREELLELGFLPVMLKTVAQAVVAANAHRDLAIRWIVQKAVGVAPAVPKNSMLTPPSASATPAGSNATAAALAVLSAGPASPDMSTRSTAASRRVDRYANADAASSCALALSALTLSSRAVIHRLLDAGLLDVFRNLMLAAATFL
ncbi:MAG: hypothetical protein EOO41_04680, partial [Methanobacteriota archaeon]